MDKKVSKFNYDSYAFKNDQARPFIQTFSQRNCKRICICSNYNESKCFECFKCKQKIHYCTRVQINRPQIHSFQCMSCLARCMDLIYQPQTILIETFFKTQHIFQKSNSINFEFTLKFEQTNFPIDVRCFKGSKIQLVWPMQGEFYLNGSIVPAFVLKPLKSNSNRKNRKQDNFLIQPELLKQGLNTLTFKIPRLQKGKFIDSFQYEQTGIYYLALYSVKELTNQQVLNITQRERRHEKVSTLALFHLGDQQLPTQKQKIRLIDPYTCERIKFPVRGRYCKHVSTICLLTYIQFQKRSRSWKCPICAVEVGSFLNQPYLDVWIYEILKQKDKGDSVIVYANGMYEWDVMEKKVMSLDDDSDDFEEEQRRQRQQNAQQVDNIIQQQQPLVLALQNIQLESSSHPQQQQLSIVSQQVDLCEYDYVIDQNNNQCQNDHIQEQLMENRLVGNDEDIEIVEVQGGGMESQGEMSDGVGAERNVGINMMQDEEPFRQHEGIVADVLIDDDDDDNQHLHDDDSHISSSNSELQQLAAQNKFIPPSIISNIIPTTSPLIQQNPPVKAPQIYSSPLQIKQKPPLPNYVIQGSNIIEKQLFKLKTNQQRQILNNNTSEKTNKIIIPSKFPLPKLPKPTAKTSIQNQQIIHETKRLLLQRPTFAQQLENVKKQKSLSLSNQRHQPISFGKMNRKNIEISQSLSPFKTNQQTSLKSQPKTQYNPFGQIFPFPKSLKKEEPQQEKPKSIKIKTMKFDPISHSKFIKHYCNIPIPPLTRKMNQDMKRLFRNILEVD